MCTKRDTLENWIDTWTQASKEMRKPTLDTRIPPSQATEATPRTNDSFTQEMTLCKEEDLAL